MRQKGKGWMSWLYSVTSKVHQKAKFEGLALKGLLLVFLAITCNLTAVAWVAFSPLLAEFFTAEQVRFVSVYGWIICSFAPKQFLREQIYLFFFPFLCYHVPRGEIAMCSKIFFTHHSLRICGCFSLLIQCEIIPSFSISITFISSASFFTWFLR